MSSKKQKLAIIAVISILALGTILAVFPGAYSYASTTALCHYSQTVQVEQKDDGRSVNGTLAVVVTLGNWTTSFSKYGIYSFPHSDIVDGSKAKYVIVNGQTYNASSVEWTRHLGYGVHLNESEVAVLPPSC